jgi:hypothetical protein
MVGISTKADDHCSAQSASQSKMSTQSVHHGRGLNFPEFRTHDHTLLPQEQLRKGRARNLTIGQKR